MLNNLPKSILYLQSKTVSRRNQIIKQQPMDNTTESAEDKLSIANRKLLFQNEEKEKRAAELSIANKELIFQNEEKEKRAAELSIANKN